MEPSSRSTRHARSPGAPAGELRQSAVNALKLTCSLVVTWSVALGVRLLLPRYLGPELFGAYSFADGLAASFFVLATLGVETYIRKEVPVRPWHASEFLGGVLLVRLVLAVLLAAAMAAVLGSLERPAAVRAATGLLALGHLVFITNDTLAALLQARGLVGGLSVVNVAGKLLWAACLWLALGQGLGLVGVAAAFLGSEALKAGALLALCRRQLGLRLGVDVAAARGALAASLPFFVATLASVLASRVDITLITLLAGEAEAGWYSAASNLACLALLLTPLLFSVLMPMLARLAARSQEALDAALQRALALTLTLCLPVCLALGLGAELWTRLALGAAYAPAAPGLRLLAPLVLLTYVAILCSIGLTLRARAWTATCISLTGGVVNPALNLLLIHPMLERWGPGGAGAGAALATLGTEALICGLMLGVLGRRVVDGRLVGHLLRLLAVGLGVIALDWMWAGLGDARLLLDAGAFGVLALLLGTPRVSEVRAVAAAARRHWRERNR